MDFFGILWDWVVVVVGIEIRNAEIDALKRLGNFGISAANDACDDDDSE